MSLITKLLEESPGVRSSARLIAIVLTCLVVVVALCACAIGLHVVFHASAHGPNAPLVVQSSGSIIQQLTMLLVPLLGGVWIALGMRKRPDDGTSTTTVTETRPAGAPASSVSVTPAAPGSQ